MEVRKDIIENLLKISKEYLNDKWITIKPHGEDSDDYRRLKLEDGETPKEAIDRVYKKKDSKNEEKKDFSKLSKKELASEIFDIEEKQGIVHNVTKDQFIIRYLKGIGVVKGYSKEELISLAQRRYEDLQKMNKNKQTPLSDLKKDYDAYLDILQKHHKLLKQYGYSWKPEDLKKYQEEKDKLESLKEKLEPRYNEYKRRLQEETIKNRQELEKNIKEKTKTIREDIKKASKRINTDSIIKELEQAVISKQEFNKKLNEMSISLNEFYDKNVKGTYGQEGSEENLKKYEKMASEFNKLKKIQRSNQEFLNKVNMALQVKNGAEIKTNYTSTVKENAENLEKNLKGVISQKVMPKEKINIKAMRGYRAYYTNSDGMTINKYSNDTTLIHEAMHWLEHKNQKVLENSLAFLEYRTKGEEAQKLNKLTKTRNYGADEISKKDNFFSPYCGKIYQGASEIMSMGLQKIFENPVEFAKQDREYFDFVIANLRGEL